APDVPVVANDNAIPFDEPQSGQWVRTGTGGWDFQPGSPSPSFDPLPGRPDPVLGMGRTGPGPPPLPHRGEVWTTPFFGGQTPKTTKREGRVNQTTPGTMEEIPFKEGMKTESRVYLYELVDAEGNHLKWGTARDPYQRFNGYVAEGLGGARMKVYRPHPRYQA